MPHVQEAGRVGEHLQTVEMLRARRVRLDLERARLLPRPLPLLLYLLREILFVHDSTGAFPHLTVNDRPALSQAHRGRTDFRLIVLVRNVAAAKSPRARSRATPTPRHRKEELNWMVKTLHRETEPHLERCRNLSARDPRLSNIFVTENVLDRATSLIYSRAR